MTWLPRIGAQLPHVHRLHTCRPNGLQTEVGVFVGPATFRCHPDAARGLDKNVGRGFLIFYHFAGYDGVEEMPDS